MSIIPTVSRAQERENLVGNPTVVLETNQGNIEIKLYPNIAPKACQNFIGLIKKGYYDGIIFHRVIKNFMIQGGDPTGTGMGGEARPGRPAGFRQGERVFLHVGTMRLPHGRHANHSLASGL